MSKKTLNIDSISNELEGASAFFKPIPPPPPAPKPQDLPKTEEPPTLQTIPVAKPRQTKLEPEKKASMQASTLASNQETLVETIRKTVKQPGREVSFVRLTQEEKNRLADIVYTYKRQGVKTTENEVNRIAVNFMLEDYHTNGQTSVLAQVIAALLA